MDINILIVDNDLNQAYTICKIVNDYQSKYRIDGIQYKIKLFDSPFAFGDAWKYLTQSQIEVDIMLIDYELIQGKGTDLFELIKKDLQVYKILHSETAKSLLATRHGHKIIYDAYCETKGNIDVEEELKIFESEILDIKLYGNKRFRDPNFTNRTRLTRTKQLPKFGGVLFFDILFAFIDKTIRNKQFIRIFYRDHTTKKIKTFPRSTHRLTYFEQEKSFKRVGPTMVINLLWVASIDAAKKVIRFITLDNSIFEFPYDPEDSCFNLEILPFLSDINNGIPEFFRR